MNNRKNMLMFLRMMELGLTQRELAERAGVSPGQVHGMLNNKILRFKPVVAQKIAKALETVPEEMGW